jgi:hypothetical protein
MDNIERDKEFRIDVGIFQENFLWQSHSNKFPSGTPWNDALERKIIISRILSFLVVHNTVSPFVIQCPKRPIAASFQLCELLDSSRRFDLCDHLDVDSGIVGNDRRLRNSR